VDRNEQKISKEIFGAVSLNNSLLLLCLIVSESVSEDMEKNSPYLYEMPWVPYNKDTKIIHVVSMLS
jgi:hypothetical protein